MYLAPGATILDIQRMSTEDGPGLRTTVFLKGCNLRCSWCHNPESIDPRPVVQWNGVRCIGCDSCRGICKSGALLHREQGILIDSTRCTLCLTCVNECPSGALNVKGEIFQGEQLLKELLKDRAYFGSEGGITISGGEPLLQFEMVMRLLRELKNEGLNTALDTAGLVPQKNLLEALVYTDLLLYDIKLIDSALHKKFTGRENEMILENLRQAAPIVKKNNSRLWIRTPVIPGATDSVENIAAIADFIATHIPAAVERWELCAFNNLCESKYRLARIKWLYSGVGLIEREAIESLAEKAREKLKNTAVGVFWTGTTRSGNEEDKNGE